MKFTVIIFLLLAPVFLYSQEYSEVVQVENKTATQLYNSAHQWMAIAFNSANDVIQLEDPANHKLIAKGIKDINHVVSRIQTSISMYFTLITEFKDGRYRYQIYPTVFITKAGEELSYQTLKEITTEEGLNSYYKSKNIKPWIIGKKQFEENLKSNQELLTKIDTELQNIPKELYNSIVKSDNDSW